MTIVCAVNAISESLVRRYDHVKAHLSEHQRRVWLGAEARELGAGGVRVVAAAAGVSPDTVRRGRDELDDPQPPEVGRSRGPGGDVNGPRCWRRGWWGRWTPWLSPSLAVTR